jgi:hypothetical protein
MLSRQSSKAQRTRADGVTYHDKRRPILQVGNFKVQF